MIKIIYPGREGEPVEVTDAVACLWWSRAWLKEVMLAAADGEVPVTDGDVEAFAEDAGRAIEEAVDGEESVYDAVFDLAYDFLRKKGGDGDED